MKLDFSAQVGPSFPGSIKKYKPSTSSTRYGTEYKTKAFRSTTKSRQMPVAVGRSVGLVQQARRRRRGRRETRRISCRGAKLLTNKHRRNIGEREEEGGEALAFKARIEEEETC